MQPHVSTERLESSSQRELFRCERWCPVCGGPSVDHRLMRRCVRCGFTICEGCEGGELSPDEE